ncbi:uncharacterized protein [Diadema antillarum]|uniref:uncharacterized protein n=1 Tax=Diadema antillarum TaxID=105358 RepID=UPI003A8A9C26
MATSHDDHGWTHNKLLELVEIYKSLPCLYDNTSSGYHNREERARSWVDIADRMGKDEEEVRAKMKSIRTQYARIIQKGQHPKCKTAFTVSSWWLLPKLSFLDDFIIPRKADSESIKENDLLESSVNGDIADIIYDNVASESDISQPPISTINTNPSQLDQPISLPTSSAYQTQYTRRISPISISRPSISQYRSSNRLKVRRPLKKLKKDHAPLADAPSSSTKSSTEEMSSNLLLKTVLTFAERTSQEEDEDAVFGRYVGNEMRGVTDIQAKRIAKMRIQKVLFEAQTGWTETSNEGIYHAPRDGDGTHTQDGYPVGVVCDTNSSRIL